MLDIAKEGIDGAFVVAIFEVFAMEFAAAAAKNNWVKDEPLMRPKSQANPDGFDYEQELEVLKGDTLSLPGGAKLQVVRITTPTEAPHETLLYSTSLNALFASDLVYNGVHLWLGREVTEQAIQSWKSELQGLSAKYSRPGLKVYAGHGEQADTKVFETDINYLNEILRTVRASTSETAAKASMRKKYSSWESADFILEHSLKNLFARLK